MGLGCPLRQRELMAQGPGSPTRECPGQPPSQAPEKLKLFGGRKLNGNPPQGREKLRGRREGGFMEVVASELIR